MHQTEFICRAAVVVFAVALGFSTAGGPQNPTVALGVAAGLFPLVLTTETSTWKQCRILLAYHISAWIVFVSGADPGAVLGFSVALFVGAVVAARAELPTGGEYRPLTKFNR